MEGESEETKRKTQAAIYINAEYSKAASPNTSERGSENQAGWEHITRVTQDDRTIEKDRSLKWTHQTKSCPAG